MITLLTGENSFELGRSLQTIINAHTGNSERLDGGSIELRQLPDILMGATLFSNSRLIIIRELSENKIIWPVFSEWIPRISDDIHLILVEPKIDKRTKTYKDLKKHAVVQDFPLFTDHDTAKAEQWLAGEARLLECTIDRDCIRFLVQRVGTDQWRLHHALQKLSVLETITREVIEQSIDANPVENVFNLFEAALKGDSSRVRNMIQTLSLTEDPYRLFGLLSGQAFQLAAVTVSNKTSAEVAKDLGVHPYGLSKMSSYANALGRSGSKRIITAFAAADADLKSSGIDPWLLIERALRHTMSP